MILVEASGRSAVCTCFANMHNGLTHPCLKVKLMDYWHATATARCQSPDGYGSQIAIVRRTYMYIYTMQASGYWIVSIAKP